MKTTFGNGAKTATAKANSWRTVQRNKQSTRDMMSPKTIGETEGGGNQSDSLCPQKGYLDVRFMFATKSTAASATFKLACSMKQFIIAGRHFDKNFCILPLYGDGNQLVNHKMCRIVKTRLRFTTDIVLRKITSAEK
jgi:hypothetical protein